MWQTALPRMRIPLRCPVGQNPMRAIAVMDDLRAVEKVLR
jgi:hypothetical protein